MLKLARYLAGYGRECVLSPAFKLLEALFGLLVPLVMSSVIDQGIATGDRHHVLVCATALVAMGVVGWACSITAQYFSAKLSAGFGTALRDDLFRHVMGLSRADVDELGTSTLVTRLTNDTNQVQDGVNLFFRLVLRSPITVFGATGLAFLVDGWEGLLFCGIVAVVALLVWLVMRVSVRRFRRVQHALDAVLGSVSEELEGVRPIRALNRQTSEAAAFDGEVDALRHEQVRAGDVSALMNPLTYVAVNLGLAAVLAAGGIRIDAGGLTQGQLVALVNYLSQMLTDLLRFADLVVSLSKAQACAGRVNEVFARTPAMADGAADATGAAATLEFLDVSFTYPGAAAPALSHVSFSAAAGQVVGIIGGTGSGKSTLAALAMRFYDATVGEVRVGGQDVRAFDLASLHHLVGIVDQQPHLFSGTVAGNLRWGDEAASEETLRRAVATAQATDVVEAKGGLGGQVEQLGRNLSGGQRQRLSIARTLVRAPRILILDDASSALDLATDARLRRALANDGERTQLVISQRVPAIRHADRILVLDAGRLVGSGTHEELLASCREYQEICASQLERGEGVA